MQFSTALRTALLWLLDRLKPSEQPSEQELIEYSRELAQRRIPRLLPPAQPPSTYEPPEKTTDPTQQIHRLAETGRLASMIRPQKLSTVRLRRPHFYQLEPEPQEAQADKWLLDVEPAAPEPEDEDPDPTTKVRAILKLKHESKEQAS